jgi:hypothetical protein
MAVTVPKFAGAIHFWWPDLPGDMREILRVHASRTGMKLLSVGEHRDLFADAGYADVQLFEERDEGWICGVGRKL